VVICRCESIGVPGVRGLYLDDAVGQVMCVLLYLYVWGGYD